MDWLKFVKMVVVVAFLLLPVAESMVRHYKFSVSIT